MGGLPQLHYPVGKIQISGGKIGYLISRITSYDNKINSEIENNNSTILNLG